MKDQHFVKSVRIWICSGPDSVRMRENMDQNNSEYGLFSHSVTLCSTVISFSNLKKFAFFS